MIKPSLNMENSEQKMLCNGGGGGRGRFYVKICENAKRFFSKSFIPIALHLSGIVPKVND